MTIHIGKILEGETSSFHFKTSEPTIKRMETMGLSPLLIQKDGAGTVDGNKWLSELEHSLWEAASKIKTKKFSYKKEDFMKSINFLEIFCLYCAQKTIRDDPKGKTQLKAIKELEYLARTLEQGNKRDRHMIKPHVEKTTHLINKVFTESLNQTEQIAMGKVLAKTKKVFNKMQ